MRSRRKPCSHAKLLRQGFGRGARQYCGAVGKRANCQLAVSVHAATDSASCPLEWQLYLPREKTDEPGPLPRGRGPGRRGTPGEVAARARPARHTRPVAAESAGRVG
ncbi:transposase [Streptomyces sp. NPDC086783]|uniref:transposase n=1 Tax=Streptomyces sp. NPDC086783 TaxID=3365758 RepID=UPI00380C1529